MEYLYNENYKTLKKEIEETLEDGKTSYIHGSAEYYKNGYTLESNLQIQCNHYQNSNAIFSQIEKPTLNVYGSIKDHK
jgi:hypothetical protein